MIGTGFGARVVAPTFAATPGCEVVDVVSPRDPFAVEQLCRRRDLDLVSIHSPPFLHASDVELALARPHHVLCDKPFGLHADESRHMADEAQQAGIVALVNFEFRHHPVRAKVRELVLEGAVGAVEHVSWTCFSSAGRDRPHGWLFERDKGGGWIGAWASHAVDFLRWTFGEIEEASALRRTDVGRRSDRNGVEHDCDAEDAFTATMRTASGVSIAIDTSFVAPANVPHRLVVLGGEGFLESASDSRITLWRAGEGLEEIPVARGGGGDPHADPMRRWAEVVRDAVHDGVPVGPTFEDGWACDVVLDRLRGRH